MDPPDRSAHRRCGAAWLFVAALACCGGPSANGPVTITFSGSAVGQEGDLIRSQLAAFARANPDVTVELQATPDAADQRHQLYVQWLNARVPEPDVLQLDVIWTAEFAAAGWITPLDEFSPATDAFFPAAIDASRWRDSLYAMPGRDVTDLEPQERDVAMVFQSYALYPHKTVAENIAFPLRVRSVQSDEIRAKVERVAELLDIADLLTRKPAQLSGGQRQRVALARAVVREPQAFLLDEPLSNLDPAMRQHTRTELARLHRRLGVTTLYVTHDQEEAMTLGDRVAVLRNGRLEQVAPPMELYRRPATRFVASFIGSPPMNFFECRVTRIAEGVELDSEAGIRVRLERGAVPQLDSAPSKVIVGIRPHDVEPVGPGDTAAFRGVVELVEPRGSDVVMSSRPAAEGTGPASAGALVAVLPADTRIAEGDPFSARFPADRLHFFDPATGARLT